MSVLKVVENFRRLLLKILKVSEQARDIAYRGAAAAF
jgi:hypothetical protein